MSATNRKGGGSRNGSGRVRHCVGRVGSDNWLLKSGRVQTLVGRVGSEKLDPGTTLAITNGVRTNGGPFEFMLLTIMRTWIEHA